MCSVHLAPSLCISDAAGSAVHMLVIPDRDGHIHTHVHHKKPHANALGNNGLK